ncbi:MAG: 16S rRNA (uracil(1498)-N(3))-methyltransferase [Variovorax sp.]
MPRFFCALPLVAGSEMALPPGATRHVQVLRLQPGSMLVLFDGHGGEHRALVERMGRGEVVVRVGARAPIEREAPRAVHLAIGMPANERMDWLVEKATELGVQSIQPLATQRAVLRLSGERAERRALHWQAVAIAACEQCGRNRVPSIHSPRGLAEWLKLEHADAPARAAANRWLLSLDALARPLATAAAGSAVAPTWVLSGPEGGLDAVEEASAGEHGFALASLGARTLRAETAALAALVVLTQSAAP